MVLSRLPVAVALAGGALVMSLLATGASPADSLPAPPGLASTSYVVQLAGGDQPVAQVADQLAGLVGGRVTQVYQHVFRGFAVTLPVSGLARLTNDPRVAVVSPDVKVRAAGDQAGAPWGPDRIDQRALPLDGRFRYLDPAGAGSNVYVIDTGVRTDHQEFAGRVGDGRNFVGTGLILQSVDPADTNDCNGHGTRVASVAAGTTWGLAKAATVHAVRVLGCDGAGDSSAIIAGMDWVAGHHQPNAVANLSLGSDADGPVDAAARGLVASGVAVVAAAGNAGADACTSSPGREPGVLTVGATTMADARAGFSDVGGCLDLFAPGEGIIGADIASTTASSAESGTSFSAPFVAGALAILRARFPTLSPTQVQDRLVAAATPGVVTDAGPGSPNRLLFVSADAPPVASYTRRCKPVRRVTKCVFTAAGSSDDAGIASYSWTFGTKTRTGARVVQKYARAGRRSVRLTVTDTGGQQATVVGTVKVRKRR